MKKGKATKSNKSGRVQQRKCDFCGRPATSLTALSGQPYFCQQCSAERRQVASSQLGTSPITPDENMPRYLLSPNDPRLHLLLAKKS